MRWYILFSAIALVLLFVFSPLAFTEEQADITKQELMTLLNEREFFKEELANFKENYNLIEENYKTLDQKYLKILQKSEIIENELYKLKIESSLRTDSLQILKKETAFNFWKGFLSGFGFGFGTGNYTGFKLGVSF